MVNLDTLKKFRQQVYFNFPIRCDANMNLLDAISSDGHRCKSVVELSETPSFERQYSSITDGIADGLYAVNWNTIMKINYNTLSHDSDRVILIADCTPQPRPYAKTLNDRHITHAPNPAPGNKPICVGHQYSVVSLQPNCADAQEQHWLPPLSVRRVGSHEKGNEVGMQQLADCIAQLPLQKKLVISVADSLYGTENCRKLVSDQSNWVHLFRLNSTRNVFSLAKLAHKHVVGNPPRYADKMKLNDTSTHIKADEQTQKTFVTKRGKSCKVAINLWHDRVVRGSRQFKSYQHPMTLLQITVTNEEGKALYKAPLWLGITGQRRDEITAEQAVDYYHARYDIEHFFRFGKDKLLFDAYQTPDVTHEENWWHLTSLAYVQLYLARQDVSLLPKKWESYLPAYQKQDEPLTTATPSQTQRGFGDVLKQIGTPAKPCRPRGNPKGRSTGEKQAKRQAHAIIFKGKRGQKKAQKSIVIDSDHSAKNSDTKTIEQLVTLTRDTLKTGRIAPEKFYQLLLNST